MSTTDSLNAILRRLRSARTVMFRREAMARACHIVASALLFTCLILVLELVLHLSSNARTVIVLSSAAGFLLALGVYAGPALLRLLGLMPRPSDEEVARIVGGHFPVVHDSLANA